MALVIEDGTGVAGANSYATAAEVRTYAEERERSLPEDVTDAQIEAALLDAADYLNTLHFIGFPVSADQTLTWPRCYWNKFAHVTGMPAAIKRAQIETAILTMSGIDPLETVVPGDQVGSVIEDTVGPLTTRYSAISGSEVITAPVLTRIDAILLPWVYAGGVRLERA